MKKRPECICRLEERIFNPSSFYGTPDYFLRLKIEKWFTNFNCKNKIKHKIYMLKKVDVIGGGTMIKYEKKVEEEGLSKPKEVLS
jgi:hypothetical protein